MTVIILWGSVNMLSWETNNTCIVHCYSDGFYCAFSITTIIILMIMFAVVRAS